MVFSNDLNIGDKVKIIKTKFMDVFKEGDIVEVINNEFMAAYPIEVRGENGYTDILQLHQIIKVREETEE